MYLLFVVINIHKNSKEGQLVDTFGRVGKGEGELELLNLVELGHKAKSKPLEMSGGQQQRVAIARAMANKPNLLLCDEPTGNLDEENGKLVMQLLADLNAKGTTIVMVTHDLTLTRFANKVIEINDGRIV